MFLVAITAGIAQATADTSGIKLLPPRPNFLSVLSIRKTTLLMYPVSSRIEIKKNNNAICGTKIKIPAKPGITPSAKRDVKTPCGRPDLTD